MVSGHRTKVPPKPPAEDDLIAFDNSIQSEKQSSVGLADIIGATEGTAVEEGSVVGEEEGSVVGALVGGRSKKLHSTASNGLHVEVPKPSSTKISKHVNN